MRARVVLDRWRGGESLAVRKVEMEAGDERNTVSTLLAGELETHDGPRGRSVWEDEYDISGRRRALRRQVESVD
jgi:hypothetical protein